MNQTSEPDASAQVLRTALRSTLLLLVVLAVVGVAVGALVAGMPGVWAAGIGVAMALVFSATTTVALLRTVTSPPPVMAAWVMGTWLVKVLLVVVVLGVLRGYDFYSRPVLAAVLGLGVVGSALLDYRAVTRGRVPYVEPARDDEV
ncbi:hypothetical protein [Cellulomonas citrea]|uniref:hypothetical protein n=1 Tax=Cellulomonas citrea TaxID=1909423 RepID=UPI00135C8816|nr:hypothetical protein [Cellulomonas citrea]